MFLIVDNKFNNFFQALKFISEVFSLNRHDARVVTNLIKFCMERVCDVIMFCEDSSYCKKQAQDIFMSLLDSDVIRQADAARFVRTRFIHSNYVH